MRRLSNRLSRPAAVLVVGLLLGACAGGGGGANQEDVQDDVETQLAENGYVSGPGAEPVEVSRTWFDSARAHYVSRFGRG